MKNILTPNAPKPGGHYSQAILFEGQLYISGQLPNVPNRDNTETANAPFREQARRAIANVLAILAAAGGEPSNLAKITVYVVGIENWPAFNEEYAAALGAARPARSVVPVPALHYGYLVEVDAIAVGIR